MRGLGLFLALLVALPGAAWSAETMCKIQSTGAPCATPAVAQTLTGKVRVVGTSQFPVVVLTTADKDIALDGALLPEIHQLQRMTLSVTGTPMPKNGLYERLDVTDYAILDAGGGVKPLLGTLADQDGKLVLKAGTDAPVTLDGHEKTLAKLRASIGGKAWVAGETSDAGLRVKRFGILKAPIPAETTVP